MALTTSQLSRARFDDDGSLTSASPMMSRLQRTRGAPSKFDPDKLAEVEALCWHGATDPEVADFLGIDPATLTRWKHQFPDLCAALTISKEHADARVKRTLYQKAVGYTLTEKQAIKIKTGPDTEEIEIVEVEKHVPADTTAIKFWLVNRDRENWREPKQEVELGGKIDVTTNTNDRELALAVLAAIQDGVRAPLVIDGEVEDVK